MTARDLLLHQTRVAFEVDDEMSLMASLHGVTAEVADWRSPELDKSIADIVWHVAWAKLWYCEQAFGPSPISLEDPDDFSKRLRRLANAQAHLLENLGRCTEAWLADPVPTKFHGQSGAHLFTILAIHDISHAASIRARKKLYVASRADL